MLSSAALNVIVTLSSSSIAVIFAPVPLSPNDCKNAFTSSKLSSVTLSTSLNSSSVRSTDTSVKVAGALVLATMLIVDVFPSSTETVTFLSPVKEGSFISTTPEFTSIVNSESTLAPFEDNVTEPPVDLITMLPD